MSTEICGSLFFYDLNNAIITQIAFYLNLYLTGPITVRHKFKLNFSGEQLICQQRSMTSLFYMLIHLFQTLF